MGDRAERGGGGCATPVNHRRSHPNDAVVHVIEPSYYGFGSNPHNRYAVRFEKRVTALITLRPIAECVRDTVNLNGEPSLGAIEVEHVRPDRMLPRKGWHSRRAVSQTAPEHRLRRR